MRYLFPLLILPYCFTSHLEAQQTLAWRGVWEWSMPKKTDEDLIRIVEEAHRLGFNALMTLPPGEKLQFMADQCHQRKIKLYLSTVFTGGEKVWQQELSREERERFRKPVQNYQQGGEPLTEDELFDSPLPCWNMTGVREYFRKRVVEFTRLPVDGLAFDFVGYVNYYRCYCPICEKKLFEYRALHPRTSREKAAAIFAEQALVDFINEMAKTARDARPDIELTIHIYPYFRPNPYYGNKTSLDYVGQTVSWFFPPHWPLEKVKRLTREIVSTQHKYSKKSYAAPFIAFSSEPPEIRRSAERVKAELEIVVASGARALQMAELGHLLKVPEVAQVVAQTLQGKARRQ